MKVRTGFVSNSSSSSFIAITDKDAKKIEVEIKIDLIESFNLIKIETKEDYDKYIFGRLGFKDIEDFFEFSCDYDKKNREDAFKEIELGKVIYVGSVGNDDGSSLSNYLYEEGLSEITSKDAVIKSFEY